MSRRNRAPLGDLLRDVAADINADPSPEGLARLERECMESLFPSSTSADPRATRSPAPAPDTAPEPPADVDLVGVRKALDTRWALLCECRTLLRALKAVEAPGAPSGRYELRNGFHLYHVAKLIVAIDLEGETADPLTGERPVLPSSLPSMPIEDAEVFDEDDPRAGRRT